MYKEVIVYLKDGTKDLIDPVNSKEDVKYYDDVIIISNGYNDYEYDKSKVDKIEIIDIV
jgi:ribonucleotide reductase alpha subunit